MVELWLESVLYADPRLHTFIAWIMVKICKLLWLLLKIGAVQLLWLVLAGLSRLLSILWVLTMICFGAYAAYKDHRKKKAKNKMLAIAAKNIGKIKKTEP